MTEEAVASEPAPLALTCAFLCSYAYDKDRVEPGAYRHPSAYAWKWEGVHAALSDWKRFCCPESDVQVLFAYREADRTAFVAFRGTDSWKDAVVDAAVAKRALPFMMDTDPAARVHAGFLSQHTASAAAVVEYIGRHPERDRVVVSGHSLGGAVATLCASLLGDELGEPRCRCIVFGCPRVGNSAFVSRVDAVVDVRRFVVGYDPVAEVPTRVRWRHAGRRVWYLNRKRVRAPDGDPWTNVAVLPNLLCVQDHAMGAYIDCVAADPRSSDYDGVVGAAGAPGGGATGGWRWWCAGIQGIYLVALAAIGLVLSVAGS